MLKIKVEEHGLLKSVSYIFQRSATFSSPKKRPIRPLFVLLLLIVVAATFGCRVTVRNGFGSNNRNGDGGIRFRGYGSDENPPLDFPLFNSTLLKLAEIEVGEDQFRKKIEQLLEGNFNNLGKIRTFITWRWRRLFNRGADFAGVWNEFTRSLSDWYRNKKFQPDIMEKLVEQVKVPIDRYSKILVASKMKYSSCAVVGNSGILLSKEFGTLIDSHKAVIRLKNAGIEPYQKNVGSKTTISFVNSNIVHDCAKREDCYCHPYGTNVPIVMYLSQPVHLFDYVVCNSTHKSPLILTDPRFDMLCARIVKYYSLRRFADGSNKTFAQWISAHDGLFHYSSGMQAVMLALGICDRVSLFGFGKSDKTKHHYHTNRKRELSLHDYEAEYDFYHDLVKRPNAIPFFSETFKFPPVAVHR